MSFNEPNVEGFQIIIKEVRALFHNFSRMSETIAGDCPTTVGQRAVMGDILENGEQTIPFLAQKRPVSRQHILNLVKPLKQMGFLTEVRNPIHKKSSLLALTPEGKEHIIEIRKHELAMIKKLAAKLKSSEVEVAAKCLKKLSDIMKEEISKTNS